MVAPWKLRPRLLPARDRQSGSISRQGLRGLKQHFFFSRSGFGEGRDRGWSGWRGGGTRPSWREGHGRPTLLKDGGSEREPLSRSSECFQELPSIPRERGSGIARCPPRGRPGAVPGGFPGSGEEEEEEEVSEASPSAAPAACGALRPCRRSRHGGARPGSETRGHPKNLGAGSPQGESDEGRGAAGGYPGAGLSVPGETRWERGSHGYE